MHRLHFERQRDRSLNYFPGAGDVVVTDRLEGLLRIGDLDVLFRSG